MLRMTAYVLVVGVVVFIGALGLFGAWAISWPVVGALIGVSLIGFIGIMWALQGKAPMD